CPLDARLPYPRRFRRLLFGVARASQPSCLRLLRASNASRRFSASCSALHRRAQRLLRPRLTSAHPSLGLTASLASRQMSRPPGVRRVTLAPSTRRIYARTIRVTSGFRSFGPLAHRACASSAIRVPRAGVLPAASFPPRLAASRLPFSSGFPSPRSPEDLHLLVTSRMADAISVDSAGPGAA